MWMGRQRQQIVFCHEDDLDLMPNGNANESQHADDAATAPTDFTHLCPDNRGRYRLSELLGDPPRPAHMVLDQLWAGVWKGIVTNDTMISLRQGIARKAKPAGRYHDRLNEGYGFRARSRRSRRRTSIGQQSRSVGNWRLIEKPEPVEGLIEEAEIIKERVRLLLDRYGILFRQMLARELAPFRWSAIFRSLRLMELSGEVVTGCFFKDLSGLQFVSSRMLRLLQDKLPEDRLYWLCAQDPASICGLGIDAIKEELPRRGAGSHLVYLGSCLAMVSSRKGKHLQIHLPFDHERLTDCFILFDHLLGRSIDPLPSITVERINAENAADSQFLEVLRQRFDIVVEAPKVIVYRSMDSI